jgi:hypothetical protein
MLLIVWLFIIPMLIGVLLNGILPEKRRTPGVTFILGYLAYFAVFEVIAFPCMLKITYGAFKYCTRFYLIATLILAFAGLIKLCFNLKKEGVKQFKFDCSWETRIYWGIFFVLLALQMVLSVVYSSFDGDDAYYVVESLLAQQADVMNTILPYTGTSTSLDYRHCLAVITMWIAYVAKMSGIHSTIVSHSVIPLLIIPFVYLVYAQLGKMLFKKKQEAVPVFMLVVSALMIFGNVSIYTPATFFLTRTWQGKAMVSNLVFPLILWIFLWLLEDAGKDTSEKELPLIQRMAPWIMLTLINVLSGICSSMGIIFGGGLVALYALVLLLFKRKFSVIAGAFCSVIPNMIYLIIYLYLRGF